MDFVNLKKKTESSITSLKQIIASAEKKIEEFPESKKIKEIYTPLIKNFKSNLKVLESQLEYYKKCVKTVTAKSMDMNNDLNFNK